METMPDNEALYRALVSRDARFDGSVFYGITSTGIYCRPVCPARTPRSSNCRFYPSAAAAQEAGFRPCLRCRPETAPRSAAWRGTSNTVSRALSLIDEGALDGERASVESLADRVGVGERQLRRLFLKHLGASPVAVAQTRRVLFAKQLLHDTRLPMAAVAEASGFGSLRRFHEVFQQVFGRPPASIRRANTTDVAPLHGGVTLRVRYRPPYRWSSMLDALRAGAEPGVDAVHGNRYHRRLQPGGREDDLIVSHDAQRNSLLVTLASPHLRSLPLVLSRVRRLFDTDADPAAIDSVLALDPMLAPLVLAHPGLRVPGPWEAPQTPPTDLHDDGMAGITTLLNIATRLDPSLDSAGALHQRSQAWRPWRAYVAQHLRIAAQTEREQQ